MLSEIPYEIEEFFFFFILVLLLISNHILYQPDWDNFANESGCML